MVRTDAQSYRGRHLQFFSSFHHFGAPFNSKRLGSPANGSSTRRFRSSKKMWDHQITPISTFLRIKSPLGVPRWLEIFDGNGFGLVGSQPTCFFDFGLISQRCRPRTKPWQLRALNRWQTAALYVSLKHFIKFTKFLIEAIRLRHHKKMTV